MSTTAGPDRVPYRTVDGQEQQLRVGMSEAHLVAVESADGTVMLLTWQNAERLRACLAAAVSAVLRGERR